MDVQLYVYDLTQGMARAMSRQLLGIQIDAVYHTSLVFNNVEYFYGAGVQTCYPGSTHHGRPMDVISMGTTQLPLETILDYLESLKEVYTPESYDLFAHNCNNFTNDFGIFLVGKGIPEHITGLPRRVLDTPFGQMLRPHLDQGMRAVTQAPIPAQDIPPSDPTRDATARPRAPPAMSDGQNPGTEVGGTARYGSVINVTSLIVLQEHLQGALDTAATIFFTSSTCAPCKIAYPVYDLLAVECNQALFIKVDINAAHDVAAHYRIRATPTFMTFLLSAKQDEWTGADPNLLKANVERLYQQAFPPHPHTSLRVPTLQFGSMKPVTYVKIPPIDKLTTKLGAAAQDRGLVALREFVEKRQTSPKDAPLPDMKLVESALRSTIFSVPVEVRFAAIDLLRCAMIDPRISGFLAKEADQKTVRAVVEHINGLGGCPHSLRLVTLHLACNIFTSPLFVKELTRSGQNLVSSVVQLVASSLLDASHPTTRVAAASLAFNLATTNYRARRETKREAFEEPALVELAASLIETLSAEDNADALKALLLALGYLTYCAPQGSELIDLVKALDAKATVMGCKTNVTLAAEVASLL